MQRAMGSGRQWVTSPSVFPPEQFSSLAAVAVDLSSHFSRLLGMTCAALHGKLRDSLQKYLGRSAFLIPGSTWGASWDRLLMELLRNAKWWQVWGLSDNPPGNKGWLRGTEQIHQLPNVGLREGDLCNTSPCCQAAAVCPLSWLARCCMAGYVNQQQVSARKGNPPPYPSPVKKGCI